MNKKKNLSGKPERLDYWLLAAALLLACFGLMMVLSASGIMAERFFDDKYLFFKKQAIFLVAGTCMMYICSRLPKGFFYNMVYVWLMAAFVLLLLCDFSPLSVAAGGAKRWIALGPLRIQPLEFCKPALVLYLAYFFSRKQELIKNFQRGIFTALRYYRSALPAAYDAAGLRRLGIFVHDPLFHESRGRNQNQLSADFANFRWRGGIYAHHQFPVQAQTHDRLYRSF